MVFQQYALFPHMTVIENVEYGLKVRGWSREQRKRRAESMLELVGLRGFGGRYPRELSGGQQQRVALARALAYEPDLLLMDEPLGALDRVLRAELIHELRKIHRISGTTVLYVTHDAEEALALANRIMILRDGVVIEDGNAQDLYLSPMHEYTARILSSANMVSVMSLHADTSSGWVVDGSVRVRADLLPKRGVTVLAFRPRSVRLGSVEECCLQGEGLVQDILQIGDEVEVIVDLGDKGLVRIRAPLLTVADLELGKLLRFGVERENVCPVVAG
jgi:ABC-type Fe3+/spermidine/putrescine transport system ATPase subunit